MAKRFTDTDIWDKEWFMKLSPKHKLLIKFLFAKCDAAGVWTPNYSLASLYVGYTISQDDISEVKSHLETLPDGKIWIPDFIPFQYGDLSEKCAPHRKVILLLKKHGIFERVSSRVSSRVLSTLKEKEEEEDKDKEGKKKKKGDGQNLEATPLNIPGIEPFQHIDAIASEYLTSAKYEASRQQLCISLYIKPEGLEKIVTDFNAMLTIETKTQRQAGDWISHLRNWIRKTGRNAPQTNPTAKADKTQEIILKRQSKAI